MLRRLKFQLVLYGFVALAGGAGVWLFVMTYNPKNLPVPIFTLLYAGIYVFVFGLVGLSGLILRMLFSSQISLLKSPTVILRQSLLLALLVTVALLFQSNRLLNLYTSILLVACIGALELYFISR